MNTLRKLWLLLLVGLVSTIIAQGLFSLEEVRFKSAEALLAGTLSLPSTPGPHPALILLTGSGPQDRDEYISVLPNYRPFKTLAEHLSANGFAVLRYDDRGVGQSTGNFSTATSADFALDAEAALRYLLTRKDIDAKHIGLLGHSEGGLVAAMVAARNPNVSFVVSMAGTAVRGDAIIMEQSAQIMRANRVPESTSQGILQQQRQQLDLLMSGDWAALEAFTYDAIVQQYKALPLAEQQKLGDLEVAAKAQTAQSMVLLKGWMYFFVTHDPGWDWANVHVPVLALFGGLDLQVLVGQNRPALEAALAKANNPNLTVKTFADANHLFLKATTGSPDEYPQLSPGFVPGFLEAITTWLQQQVKPVAGS